MGLSSGELPDGLLASGGSVRPKAALAAATIADWETCVPPPAAPVDELLVAVARLGSEPQLAAWLGLAKVISGTRARRGDENMTGAGSTARAGWAG